MADTKDAPAAADKPNGNILKTVGTKALTALKSVGYWGTLLTGLQHAWSAFFISVKDWHVLIFWVLIVAGSFWLGGIRADMEWRPVADHLQTVNTTLAGKVRELTAKPIPACLPVACQPQQKAAAEPAPPAPAAEPAPKVQTHLRKKKASSGFLGLF